MKKANEKKSTKGKEKKDGGKKAKAGKPKAVVKGRGGKKGKATKATKAAKASILTVDLAAMKCPCCSKRCPLSKPKCGKGRAIARKRAQKTA